MDKGEVKRISDVLDTLSSMDEYQPIVELMDKELLITEFRQRKGKFGLSLVIVGECDGEPFKTITSSVVLRDQAAVLIDHLPLVGQIHQEKTYYTFL